MNEDLVYLQPLVKRLIRLTRNDKLTWVPTDEGNRLLLTRQAGAISLTCVDNDGRPPFVIEIASPSGEIVESITIQPRGVEAQELAIDVTDLWALARRKASGIDVVLRDLETELAQEETDEW
jgi:hypothetical protein